jgi:branched-chain amino acid transport system ATP-binding protein
MSSAANSIATSEAVMLTVQGLNVAIQQTTILHGVDLAIPANAIAGLIGRNGAGKTTLMRSLMGLIRISSGHIMFEGDDLAPADAFIRARRGIGYMPEDRRLIPDLTVEENVLLPAWASAEPQAQARLEFIYERMPEVAGFAARRADQLSGGQQKLVALARALMSGSRLLLLDEPFEGVAPALARRLAEVVDDLRGSGVSVLLSESDYTHSAELIDKLFVIERGAVSERPVTRPSPSQPG